MTIREPQIPEPSPSELQIVDFEERWHDDGIALWGSSRMASSGRLHDVTEQPGVVALLDGRFAGVVTWVPRPAGEPWEVLTVHSAVERVGAATALLAEVSRRATAEGVPYLWLITTNDNTQALRFYQRRGWRLIEVRAGAVDRARRDLKPEIPVLGNDDIPIRDELVLRYEL